MFIFLVKLSFGVGRLSPPPKSIIHQSSNHQSLLDEN